MKNLLIYISSGLTRLLGNVCKILSYPFHFLLPKVRFTIPKYSSAKLKYKNKKNIPNIIWQTNYTNKVTLPVYLNYLFNRLMSLDFDYYYASDDDRIELIKKYGSEKQFNAFLKLTDGASQADFWRLFVLNLKGGVYLDIDAQLIWPLRNMIAKDDNEVILLRKKVLKSETINEYTNYFLASSPDNWILKSCLNQVVENIECKRVDGGVYQLTGPAVLNQVIGDKKVNHRLNKLTCSQGTFTNEYFQYFDKKKGKWTYADKESLIKDDE